jgi:hypothetical protein
VHAVDEVFSSQAGVGHQTADADWVAFQRPDNEIPATVALDRVLASSEELVVFVGALSVYRNGIELAVEVRSRGDQVTEEDLLLDALHGHRSSANRLLLGVEFADGRRATNVGLGSSGGPGRPDGPDGVSGVQLWSTGGEGSAHDASATFFLSPLPPPGELRLYCAWPAAGVEETVTVVDADEILRAAARARELWPRVPARAEPREPRRPDLPEGGWFAGLADAAE